MRTRRPTASAPVRATSGSSPTGLVGGVPPLLWRPFLDTDKSLLRRSTWLPTFFCPPPDSEMFPEQLRCYHWTMYTKTNPETLGSHTATPKECRPRRGSDNQMHPMSLDLTQSKKDTQVPGQLSRKAYHIQYPATPGKMAGGRRARQPPCPTPASLAELL